MRARKAINLLIVIAVLASFGAACARPASSVATGGKLTYGLTLVTTGIDPHQGASSELGIFLTSVYDPLVWQTAGGEFVPGLAQTWEVSPDNKIYTFHLRRDVKFHDGTPLNAAAVKFSFDRIMSPELRSQKAIGMMGPYEKTEVVDDSTVRVYFKQPYAPFLDACSQVYLAIVSPTAVQKWGEDYREHQVGTGPFLFQEYVPKDHVTLAKNPDYAWAPDFMQHKGPAYLDEITFRFYPDPPTRAAALEAGEADVMGEMPPQDARRLEEAGTFQIVPAHVPGQSLQFFLNTQKFPTDSLQVRQAILYAVDREAIVRTIFRSMSPIAWGPISADTPGYSQAVEGTYKYDLDKARALLAAAGCQDSNGDGIVEKDGQPATLAMIVQTWGYVPEVAQMIQAMLRQIGLDVRTEVLTYPAALQAAGEGRHNMAPQCLSASDPDSALSPYFHSRNLPNGYNWAKYKDAVLDQLLDEGAALSEPAGRWEVYATVQEMVMDNALILPIRDYVNLNVAASKVKGLSYAKQGWFPWLYDVHLEK